MYMNPETQQVKTMNGKVAALVLLFIGLLGLGGGYAVYYQAQIPKSYVTTTGTITSNAPGANNRTYDIGIRFTAKDAQSYSFTTSVAEESAKHNAKYFVGNNTIKVAYDPSRPDHNPKNASDKSTPAYAIIFMALGGLFAVIGLISLLQQLIFRK
jgi:hypothetical protein